MKIKFLKAGTGDAILIHHKKHNILIDGGNDSRYLLKELATVHDKGEILNLLIITHHDDDHIKGIIDLLKEVNAGNFDGKKPFIDKVIFNSPKLVLGKIPANTDRLLSYKQAHQVEELLLKMKITPEWQIITDKSESIDFDDLSLDFLSPIEEDLEKYAAQKNVYLSSDYKCDWDSPLRILEPFINDDSQDKSIPNKSSIVIKLANNNKKILLTGDVTPDRLEKILKKQTEDNQGAPVPFDYIKLPHHGSYRSLNKSILENIDCKNFIISTNSKKHFLPNKRALLKILKYSDRNVQVNFMFNYDEVIEKLKITEKEKKEYNFKLIRNNKEYGIEI